ncbi:hypothetical protein DL96DRAFT_255947 [Flagelloscypha sp. PMI_526]|nr:hypothetical protein DL96DRAFT_255947 [Flagelloscypha sp. PMI_526]
MSAPTISTEDVIAQYQSVSDFAALYILEAFMCSLSYGPVLILSIIALKRLRKRLSFTPSRSSKWLFGIILSQLIFVTLRSVCSTGLYVADFKDNHFVVLDDGSVQQLFDNSLLTVELVFICCGAVSTRAMEVLASAVLVWRAFTIYSDIFWIRFILILAWVIDFAVAAFHVGVYMQVNIGIAMYRPDVSMQLVPIALYASRWMSFALNALVTALIAYRAWKFKNVLQDAGLRTKRSMSYQILARLVETGVLLLAVQVNASSYDFDISLYSHSASSFSLPFWPQPITLWTLQILATLQ